MIKTFADSQTESLFNTTQFRRFGQDIIKRALTRLVWLVTAICIDDLKILLSNQHEKLKGDREGQYSIRVNNQYRVCFVFENDNAFDVEIVDYH